jgi:exosortase D (VPLPA-CTERM-specific)
MINEKDRDLVKRKIFNAKSIALIAGYSAFFIAMYHASLAFMVSRWDNVEYNYCYLIPFIFLYLLWEKRDFLLDSPSQNSYFALSFFVVGISLYWLGELAGEFYTLYLSSWFVFVSFFWLHWGWKKIKETSFAFLLLITLFPLPHFIYGKFSFQMQLLSSRLGVWLLQLYGTPVYREGNVIDLGFMQMQVVEACNGLRYLFPLMVLGLVMAYFFKAPFWKRIVLFLSSVPISIGLNSIRIALTGILSIFFGPKAAEGFFHDFEGWVIFMLALGIMVLEMMLLKRIAQRGGKTADDDETSQGSTDSDADESGGQRIFKRKQKLDYILFGSVSLAMAACIFIGQYVDFYEKVPIRRSFVDFPTQIEDWNGRKSSMEQIYLESLDLSDYLVINYRQGSQHINFYVAYYENQRKGESIHTPATCLPGGGWELAKPKVVEFPVNTTDNQTARALRVYMTKGSSRQMVYYWFYSRGRYLTNNYILKFFNFWDALTQQRTDGALVRVITPVGEFEELADADERMIGFLTEAVPILDEYIPGKNIIR